MVLVNVGKSPYMDAMGDDFTSKKHMQLDNRLFVLFGEQLVFADLIDRMVTVQVSLLL